MDMIKLNDLNNFNFDHWDQFFQKRYFWPKTEKNHYHHRIPHIRYSLGIITKNFKFLDQICPNRVFSL